MPPHSLLDSSKRTRNFISSRGYPRYCTVTPASTADGEPTITGARSRRGKFRGHPASKTLKSALKSGGDDAHFLDFMTRILDWDPASRLTPSQALRHQWLRRRLPKAPPSTIDAKAAVAASNSAIAAAKMSISSSSSTTKTRPDDSTLSTGHRPQKLPQIG